MLAYGRLMPMPERVAAGFFQATNLTFITAATATGMRLGKISATDASALVTAGMLSVVLFPLCGTAIMRRLALTPPPAAR